ncbi:LysR family transcriptional regulator [Polaribacter sp. 11A2H]|uniref:helix-turn-helix domain-containing protein n=1 Tax=Polaribacter sp. 11A2H TaxID=2687290 RepID=UPI00140724B3
MSLHVLLSYPKNNRFILLTTLFIPKLLIKQNFSYFLTIANYLSFIKIAEQLFTEQQAIYKSIRNLEEDYNATLFFKKSDLINFLMRTTFVNCLIAKVNSKFKIEFLNSKFRNLRRENTNRK